MEFKFFNIKYDFSIVSYFTSKV